VGLKACETAADIRPPHIAEPLVAMLKERHRLFAAEAAADERVMED